ncbi:MAG: hypothetical protein ABIA76_05245, partial [Candidatus Diapherotrites archaeon]
MNKLELLKVAGLVALFVIILTALMVFVEVNQDAVKEIISPEEQAMDLIKQDKVFKTYIEGKDYSTEL